jgi:hypothetical protein
VTDRSSSTLRAVVVAAVSALAAGAVAWAGFALTDASRGGPVVDAEPPPPGGYFHSLKAGAWARLPDDESCAGRVHRSAWEPRPDNDVPNHHVPDVGAVRAAFAARPRDTAGGYDPRWDSWLLRRVTGNHTGTTDENIQWAACKWGVSDDLLRAVAFRESGWFQGEVYANGLCVQRHGCGDMVTMPDADTRVYCGGLTTAGHNYEADYGPGLCPGTFSLVGIKSWQAPAWGRMQGNQNGTFPFNRDSTAFALDYLGAFLRGCQEGWVRWLDNVPGHYGPGMIWGCVGVWYAGDWQSASARRYRTLVHEAMVERPWLDPDWADQGPPCSPVDGCPRGPSHLSGPTTSR